MSDKQEMPKRINMPDWRDYFDEVGYQHEYILVSAHEAEIQRLKARIEEHEKAWGALLYWAKSAAAIGSGPKHLIKRIDQLRPGAEEDDE